MSADFSVTRKFIDFTSQAGKSPNIYNDYLFFGDQFSHIVDMICCLINARGGVCWEDFLKDYKRDIEECNKFCVQAREAVAQIALRHYGLSHVVYVYEDDPLFIKEDMLAKEAISRRGDIFACELLAVHKYSWLLQELLSYNYYRLDTKDIDSILVKLNEINDIIYFSEYQKHVSQLKKLTECVENYNSLHSLSSDKSLGIFDIGRLVFVILVVVFLLKYITR